MRRETLNIRKQVCHKNWIYWRKFVPGWCHRELSLCFQTMWTWI